MIAVLLVACTDTRVDGTVAGEPVEVSSATFAAVPDLFGGDGALLVYLLPARDACQSQAAWLEASATTRDPEALAQAWAATFPSTFWSVDLVLRVDDPLTSQTGSWLTGADWNAELEATEQAYGEIRHIQGARDAAYFGGLAGDDDPSWYTHRGLVQLHLHRPEDRLIGTFTTEAADPETGARAGEVVIRFDATRCADLEALLSP